MDEHPLSIAFYILGVLAMPGVIYFSAMCAYYGLVKARTITHWGVKSGIIARIYGFFYLFFVIYGILAFRFLAQYLTEFTLQDVTRALLYPSLMPIFLSLTFFGMGILMFLIWRWSLWIISTRIPENPPMPDAMKSYQEQVLAAIGLTILIGLLTLTNLPIILAWLSLLTYVYLGSIQGIKKLKAGKGL
jgi:hypothetical protein